jgi:hypothetical protein
MSKLRVCYSVGISTNLDHSLYWQLLTRVADMDTSLRDVYMKYPTTTILVSIISSDGYDLLLYGTGTEKYELDRFMDKIEQLLKDSHINVEVHDRDLEKKCMAFLKNALSGFTVDTSRGLGLEEEFHTIEITPSELKMVCNLALV